MTASERIGKLIRGKEIDRLPVMEWAPWWHLTVARWISEGLPRENAGYVELQDYFGLDKCIQTYFPVRTAMTPAAVPHGTGIMKSREDYERIKPTMFPDVTKIMSKEHFDWLEKTRQKGDYVHFCTVEGFFWYPRELFGIEEHLYSFYDNDELLHEMCEDYVSWLKKLFEFIGNSFRFDFMTFAEDMSYNKGPMISKDMFDTFLAPYYREIIPVIKRCDIPVIIDSDGDITEAVDWYASVDADGMLPLERQAGVDVSLYIEKQPQMTFLGHFDKMCMKFGEEAMRREFERILPSCIKGKVIIGVDHQTPPDVSLENYKVYVRLLKEYANKVVK